MSPLSRHLEEYLALRRRLVFKLRDASYELHKFVRFAQEAKASLITTQLALEWATQPTGCQPAQWTARLGMVRRFADCNGFCHLVCSRRIHELFLVRHGH